jgi:hypothetical protein
VKTSAVMVRRALVQQHDLRFPDRKTCEDYDLFWRAIMVARAVGYSPEQDVTVHLGPDSLSRGDDEALRLQDDLATMIAVRRWGSTHGVDARRTAAVAGHMHGTRRDAGASALRRGDLATVRQLFRTAVREEGWSAAARSAVSALLECMRGGVRAPLTR